MAFTTFQAMIRTSTSRDTALTTAQMGQGWYEPQDLVFTPCKPQRRTPKDC